MTFHMSNHIKFCLKTFIANSRVKQFFSYLSSYMPFHVLLCRAFCNNTVRTQMAQCIFLNRSKQVWFHVGFLFTYVRFYWFFTCVNLRVGVCFQFQCRKKNLLGIICIERLFFVTVVVHTSCQGITAQETCQANFTFKLFFWIHPLIQTCHEYRIKNA